jgi:hypothetical protein
MNNAKGGMWTCVRAFEVINSLCGGSMIYMYVWFVQVSTRVLSDFSTSPALNPNLYDSIFYMIV